MPRARVEIQLDEKQRAKLEWVAGRKGLTAHAYMRQLVTEALAKESNPPRGWWVNSQDED